MELVVLKAEGIPEDTILSIRAGSVRKQAPLSACDKALKFPCKVEECGNVKVELLTVAGSARALCFGGGPQTHELNFEASPNAASPAVQGSEATLSIRLQEGAGGDAVHISTESRKAKIQTETDEYMDKHCVVGALQGALKNLMRDRPDDPMEFLAKHFAQKLAGAAASFPAGVPTAAPGGSESERNQALEAENMALRQQLSSVARLASAGSGERNTSAAPTESTGLLLPPPPQPQQQQNVPVVPAFSQPLPRPRPASPQGAAADPAEQKQVAPAALEEQQRGRGTTTAADDRRRSQLKLKHEADLVKAAALERAQLMAEMGRIEALMEAARSQQGQGARKGPQSRSTSPHTSAAQSVSDLPSTRLPGTPAGV